MFKILILTWSLLANSIGAHGLAQKIERPLTTQASAKEGTASVAELAGQLPIPQSLPRFRSEVSPSASADAWLIRDNKSGTVLAEKNGYLRRPPASTIKILTALLVLEKIDLDYVTTISTAASSKPGSSAGLKAGEHIRVRDLLYGLLLNSGNDAAWALAEIPEIYGGADGFIKAMNERAKQIGLSQTSISGPDGYDETNTVSTPYDMAKMLAYVLKKDPRIREMMLVKEKEFTTVEGKNPRLVVNSNRLVRFDYTGVLGGKTGTGSHKSLGGAGHTLVAAAERNGKQYQVFIGGTFADTPTASYEEAKRLLDFTFANIQ